MLAVLTVIGLFIVIALPAFNNMTRSAALPGALRQVADEASLAREFAITHRVQAELKITNTWIAVTVLTNGYPVDKWNYLPRGAVVYFPPPTAPLPPANLVTNVFFTPTGATTNLNEVTLCVREGSFENGNYFGTNSNVGTISINNLLGRIQIQRP